MEKIYAVYYSVSKNFSKISVFKSTPS